MNNKKRWLLKVTGMLIAYAAIIPRNGSRWLVGEPQLPKKMEKR